jgi:hypothetical protein
MTDTETLPAWRWDESQGRFRAPDRCPYPDCGRAVKPLHAQRALAWCASCERPYESLRHTEAGGAASELRHRPDLFFCSRTGQALTERSLLDWPEAGGGPARGFCLPDELGLIFGRPTRKQRPEIVPDGAWNQQAGVSAWHDEPVAEDECTRALAVVRGRVVAVSGRGRIRVYEAQSGEAAGLPAIDWPDASTSEVGYRHRVRHAPAFRGTRMVVSIGAQAQFRDLKPLLVRAKGAQPETSPRLVPADPGRELVGPPLGLDLADGSCFCLLQAAEGTQGFAPAELRFFALDGEELTRLELPEGLQRPPLFDAGTRTLVWVDGTGGLHTLELTTRDALARASSRLLQPREPLRIKPQQDASFAVGASAAGEAELWLVNEEDARLVLYSTGLEGRLRSPKAPWNWSRRALPAIGSPRGLAVGQGSRYEANVVSQYLAITTHERALLLGRSGAFTDGPPRQAGEGAFTRGSHDPPLLCAAGMIVRLQGQLLLDNQGFGWAEGERLASAVVPGSYEFSQGLAIFGRRVFLGYRDQVMAFDLLLEGAR